MTGFHGVFLEVTSEGETVWKYINPVVNTGILEQGETPALDDRNHQYNAVFKIHRYPPTYPGFSGRDLTPGDPIEIYPEGTPTPTPDPAVTPTPTPQPTATLTPSPGFDLDGDGRVGPGDLLLLIHSIHNNGQIDFSGDGKSGVDDLLLFQRRWKVTSAAQR